jgi:hypothetical protein
MAIKQIGIALCLIGASALAWGQTPAEPAEWVEAAVPPPPAFSTDTLLPIEMPPYVTLKIGIDPQTVALGSDGVVRYVVVMRNASGSTQAVYEGILCSIGAVKTYARAGTGGTWTLVQEPQWRDLTDNLPSRHAFALARQGVCDGSMPYQPATILRRLKQGRPSYQ